VDYHFDKVGIVVIVRYINCVSIKGSNPFLE
jgi:hypothetical protein